MERAAVRNESLNTVVLASALVHAAGGCCEGNGYLNMTYSVEAGVVKLSVTVW
jgi:hypothetical protein